ncbi:hypothetical protein K413DRAFT_4801 [Clostridium sp. ASBs410]|nr:hypothetical protein K413DRAFT_4801 [Clostridium sp. ASBs410]
MNDVRISNSIYISMATFESLIICELRGNSSIAYYNGTIWLFPLFLISIPIYRVVRGEPNKKNESE